jgi:ABC-type antimicrobial peptide transport system permease subunit
MALGADPGKVMGLVMREMLTVIFAGVAAGALAGLYCERFVETQLFGVKALDPWLYVISVAALIATSLVAAFLPARRASRIDPMLALRSD